MIYAVTFNPSVDMVFALPTPLHPGDTYNHIPWTAYAGGKGNNVARAINQLGGPVTAVGFYGGAMGLLMRQLLAEQHIPCLKESVRGSSRVSLTLLPEKITEVRGQGPEVSHRKSRTLLERLRRRLTSRDWITLSGSLPPGLSADDITEWVHTLRPHCQGIIADLAGDNLLAACKAEVTAVCPNAAEYQPLAHELGTHNRMHLVITEGPLGVLWYPPDPFPTERIYAPAVTVKNPVGAGDVFLGSLVYGLWQGQDWRSALIRAVAAASASVATEGVSEIDLALFQEILPHVYMEPA